MYLNTKDMKNKKRKQRKKKVVGRNNKRTRRQRGVAYLLTYILYEVECTSSGLYPGVSLK
jgi:hypothetical protein